MASTIHAFTGNNRNHVRKFAGLVTSVRPSPLFPLGSSSSPSLEVAVYSSVDISTESFGERSSTSPRVDTGGCGLLVLHPHPWLGGSANDVTVAGIVTAAVQSNRFQAVATYQQRGVGRSKGRSSLVGCGADMNDVARVLASLCKTTQTNDKIVWDDCDEEVSLPRRWHVVGYSWGACHVAGSVNAMLASVERASILSITLLGFPMLSGSSCALFAPIARTIRFLEQAVKTSASEQIPLFVFTPEHDEFTNAELMHKAIRAFPGGEAHAVTQVLPGLGHFNSPRTAHEIGMLIVERITSTL